MKNTIFSGWMGLGSGKSNWTGLRGGKTGLKGCRSCTQSHTHTHRIMLHDPHLSYMYKGQRIKVLITARP